MQKILLQLLILIFIMGCSQLEREKPILAKVNNYEIAVDEFEEEFKDSLYARADTYESRKEFLENIINRKLILQDAQENGLDKDKNFLKTIERFWEQSLLKLTVDKKAKEISGLTRISDKEIEQTYQKMLQESKADKPFDQMYEQIKWELTQAKASQLMNEWINKLKKKADIKLNLHLLQKHKGG